MRILGLWHRDCRIVAEDIAHTPDVRTELVKTYGVQAYACHPLMNGTTTNFFCIPCSFDCPKPVLLKDETISTHLLRIAQEAVNNARKHGQADQMAISLKQTRNELKLVIHDDGIGIPKRLPKKRGMGIKSMTRRADEIGATLSARRGDERGTIITCTLPLAKLASGKQ